MSGQPAEPNAAIEIEKLRQTWQEFTEMRKHQIAEYSLLKKDFTFDGSVITVQLSNPVEQLVLQNIRTPLINYLRTALNNNTVTVESVLQDAPGRKIAYTRKEMFDLMAEKNPALLELKERFGLDMDIGIS